MPEGWSGALTVKRFIDAWASPEAAREESFPGV